MTSFSTAPLRFSKIEKFLAPGNKRTLRGVASSANVDRMGDIVEPGGGKWRLPVVLLAQHDHNRPIGWVRSLQVKGKELHVEAEIAQGIGDADSVWAMLEARLLTGFSIGFRALPGGAELIPGGNGIRFKEWELLELSVVSVPAQADAVIQHVGKAPPKAARVLSAAEIFAARNPGAVKLLSGRNPDGVKLKPYHPGVKLKRDPRDGIPLLPCPKPEVKRIQRRADGAVDLDPSKRGS